MPNEDIFEVDDMGTGRTAKVDAPAGTTTIKQVIEKGYGELGEEPRPDDHFFDGKGNPLDGRLDEPASTLVDEQGGTTVIEIRHPTGGGCSAAPIFAKGGPRP